VDEVGNGILAGSICIGESSRTTDADAGAAGGGADGSVGAGAIGGGADGRAGIGAIGGGAGSGWKKKNKGPGS
jgi:hypothetical protein